jgi:hypothetical protein
VEWVATCVEEGGADIPALYFPQFRRAPFVFNGCGRVYWWVLLGLLLTAPHTPTPPICSFRRCAPRRKRSISVESDVSGSVASVVTLQPGRTTPLGGVGLQDAATFSMTDYEYQESAPYDLQGMWLKVNGDDDFGSYIVFKETCATVAPDCAVNFKNLTLAEVTLGSRMESGNRSVRGVWSRSDMGSAPFTGTLTENRKLDLVFSFGRYTYGREEDLGECCCSSKN